MSDLFTKKILAEIRKDQREFRDQMVKFQLDTETALNILKKDVSSIEEHLDRLAARIAALGTRKH